MFFLKQLSRGCCAQTEATRGRQDCISGARVSSSTTSAIISGGSTGGGVSAGRDIRMDDE
jgi:hypothetical protein